MTPSEPHTSAPSSSAHVPTGQTHSKFNGSFSTHSAPNLQSSALQILSPTNKDDDGDEKCIIFATLTSFNTCMSKNLNYVESHNNDLN